MPEVIPACQGVVNALADDLGIVLAMAHASAAVRKRFELHAKGNVGPRPKLGVTRGEDGINAKAFAAEVAAFTLSMNAKKGVKGRKHLTCKRRLIAGCGHES